VAKSARLSYNIPRSKQISFRMASTLPSTPIFNAIAKHDPTSLAIVHSASDRSFCYGSLLHDIAAAKDNLTELVKGKSLRGERIAFLAENGYDYVGTTCWSRHKGKLLI
jgi:malonyl-CoA/methylmalonyl-CoA synthetase